MDWMIIQRCEERLQSSSDVVLCVYMCGSSASSTGTALSTQMNQ